jgi:predicted MPP superfamily phosphohydrolase/orotate phosphoribosyltransferase
MSDIIIHISDLHTTYHTNELGKICEHTCLTTDPNKSEDCKSFIKKVAKSINDRFSNHNKYLIITGDIADKAEQKEYEQAESLITLLLSELKITDTSRIAIIPGDHDWHNSSVEQAKRAKINNGIDFEINEIKYKNFNEHLYNKIKKSEFDSNKIIFETMNIGDNIVFLSLNSTLKIENIGDKGDFDIPTLRNELETIIEQNPKKHLLMGFHHNLSGSYENKTTGSVDSTSWGNLLGLLNEKKIKCVFYGNEHTHNSKIIPENIFISDAGTLTGITQPRGSFKCYEIIESDNQITLCNYIGLLDSTASLAETGFGNWTLSEVTVNENETVAQFEIFNNSVKIDKKTQMQELPTATEKVRSIENKPMTEDSLSPSEYKYTNQNISDDLFKIIKTKKLFHTGHFHWNTNSRALNWIDTLKLLECYEDLLFAKNAIIDVLQDIQFKKKIQFDLMIGLGSQGTMIATKAALQLGIPFSALPYSYRQSDHNEFENQLNILKDKEYQTIVFIMDVVHDGSSIKKIIEGQQKIIFDKAKQIFVASLISTGNPNPINDKTEFVSVLDLKFAECPYKDDDKYKENCRICKENLNEVLCFYNEASY